ncbi:MAG: HAMP domain-containing sensor histidine kinase [Cyanobacteria bacterium P01_D01_bin.1]
MKLPSWLSCKLLSCTEAIAYYQNELAAYRQNAQPLYLPVLLLMPAERSSTLTTELLEQFDALLYEPVAPTNLKLAVTTLLRLQQLSAQLLQKNQELARIAASNAQFTAKVAHEFRNPLSVVSSLTQMIKRGGDSLPLIKRDTMLARMQAAINKLIKLTEGLLAFNRNISVEGQFNPRLVDLKSRCSAILSDFKFINQGMYEIYFQVEGDCSNLFVDPDLISTILNNLLSNALKYSPDDSPVSLLLERQEKQLIIEVRDNGKGIPTEDQTALFDAFFRARNAGVVEGTGLGLSIVKQCVALHGGTIELQSEVGRGTIFRITLPLDSLSASELPLSAGAYARLTSEPEQISTILGGS